MMKERDSGIDLLRVLLALMVITLHFNSSLGQVQVNAVDLSFNWYFVWLTETISFCAVNVYVIISGYYSYIGDKTMPLGIKKLKSLWWVILFYSVFEYIIITFAFGKSVNLLELGKRLLPISTGEWWFFSLYFIISLISPFLNIAIRKAESKSLLLFFEIGIIGLCFMSQILLWEDGLGVDNGYSLIWFVFLYFTGGVLAKYHQGSIDGTLKKVISLVDNHKYKIYVGCLIILYGSKIFLALVSKAIWGEVRYSGVLFSYNSIFVYMSAIVLFLIFKRVSLNNGTISHVVRFLSPLSLASYLFHCQLDFREQVWPELACYRYANKSVLPLVYIITIVCLFTVAIIIEYIRTKVASLFKKSKIARSS